MTLIDADPGDIPAFLDRRPLVGSFTMLHTIKNICEYQGWRRFIKKDIPFFETDAMKWGKEVHEAMAKRVGQGKVLPENMKDWDKHAAPFDNYEVLPEQKLGITAEGKATGFFSNDVWYRGVLDAPVVLHDKALLTDWKVGSSKYEDPFELATHALLLKAKHPQIRSCVGRYVYLKEDRAGRMYDLSDFQATWLEINRLMNLIAEKRKSGDWEKKKSGLCGYCPCGNCENHYVARPT
jgi:hypothetical protein